MKRTFVFITVLMGCALVALVCAPAAAAQCFPAAAAPPCCATTALTFTAFAPAGDFIWAPAAVGCPVTFDVSAGDLATAWMAKTVVGGALTVCLPGEDGAPGLAAADATLPAVGQGFWYLVRTENVVGVETWNELSPAQVVDRDPPLVGICPF
jgi:hypothetical protein